jgi:succinoglycan biosynthesis transport protein ExoP
MQSDLVDLEARYTPDHPDVIRAKADIADLQQRTAQANAAEKKSQPAQETVATTAEPPEIGLLRNEINQDQVSLNQNTSEQTSIEKQINDYEARIKLSPSVAQEFQELTRDQQSASDHYNDALKRRDTASVAKGLTAQLQNEQFRVLDPASLPEMPSATFGMQFAGAGLGAGLFVGLLITLILEYRDKSLRTERDAEFFLEFPVVALVPQFKAPKNGAPAAAPAPSDGLSSGLNRVNSARY